MARKKQIHITAKADRAHEKISNAAKQDDRFLNNFCSTIGFGQPPLGPQNAAFFSVNNLPFSFGGGPALSNAMTVMDNLRWFMVSVYRQILSQSYVEIGLVQTIVDLPVDDGLRGGVTIKTKQLDEDQLKELKVTLDRDDDLGTVALAAKWERLFGGSGIIVLVGDQDPEEPLDIPAIGEQTELKFRDADLWELFHNKQVMDEYDPSTQSENFEHYSYYSEKVHKSRVMEMKGKKAPSFVRPRLRGWGLSVVEALIRSLNQYIKATDLSFEVLDEFKIDIFKMKDLINTLMAPDGQQTVQKRIQLANWQKNYQNALVMDSEDEWDHKQLSFTGLAEVMEGIRMQVASDMRMPIIKLFGQSMSKGLGNSAQDEMENYNSMIESEIRQKIKFHILKLIEIKCQKLFGFIPDDIEIEFKPLRELTAEQQETVKTSKWTRIQQARAMNEITSLEFRELCNKSEVFDLPLDTTDQALGEIEDEQEQAADDEAESEDGKEKPKKKEGVK